MSKKILVIDDEPDVVTYLSSLLEDNGFTVLTAYDGQEGMEVTKKEKPDLIIMSPIDAKASTEWFKKINEAGIPVIGSIPCRIMKDLNTCYHGVAPMIGCSLEYSLINLHSL